MTVRELKQWLEQWLEQFDDGLPVGFKQSDGDGQTGDVVTEVAVDENDGMCGIDSHRVLVCSDGTVLVACLDADEKNDPDYGDAAVFAMAVENGVVDADATFVDMKAPFVYVD